MNRKKNKKKNKHNIINPYESRGPSDFRENDGPKHHGWFLNFVVRFGESTWRFFPKTSTHTHDDAHSRRRRRRPLSSQTESPPTHERRAVVVDARPRTESENKKNFKKKQKKRVPKPDTTRKTRIRDFPRDRRRNDDFPRSRFRTFPAASGVVPACARVYHMCVCACVRVFDCA